MTTNLAVTARPWPEMAAILESPHCGGDLAQDDFRCTHVACGSRFRSLLGIPDLRIPQEATVDYEPDWTPACSLAEVYPTASFEDFVERLCQGRVRQEIFSREHADIRIGQIKRARLKHAEDLADTGWLGNRPAGRPRPSPRPGLSAAGRHFGNAAGIDMSMTRLVLCRKRLKVEHIPALLVCACAQRLPLRRNTFSSCPSSPSSTWPIVIGRLARRIASRCRGVRSRARPPIASAYLLSLTISSGGWGSCPVRGWPATFSGVQSVFNEFGTHTLDLVCFFFGALPLSGNARSADDATKYSRPSCRGAHLTAPTRGGRISPRCQTVHRRVTGKIA